MKNSAWLSTSLQRHFPLDRPQENRSLTIPSARGERVSFQVCVRHEEEHPTKVSVECEAAGGLSALIRRVGYVPMPHHNTGTPVDELDGVGRIPGYVPDVLYPENASLAAPGEVNAFWVTVDVGRGIAPGPADINVSVRLGDFTFAKMTATIEASEVFLPKRRDFRVTHWFYADALCDWYKVEPFDASFWLICKKYMHNYAEHGCDTIYVPVFTPPLDGVKRPTQLLRVKRGTGGKYSFDWRDVRKWIKLAGSCGIKYFEWTHLFTQWGVKHAIRIYEKRDGKDCLLWPPNTGAVSPAYKNFLSQFLPALHGFLEKEKLLKNSFFHVSDEPHGGEHLENYRKARNLLRELAPWMQVIDALSDITYAREGLTDMPVPSISVSKQFAEENIPSWTYFCCGPRGRYLNRLMDTPLAKIRMAGWLFYRFGFRGFLHWGYNYWYKSQTQQMIDPFAVTDGRAWPGWANGDPFVVYPGPDGPLDSIRWEIFTESLQDYTLLQVCNVDLQDKMFAPLQDFDDFPKNPDWLMTMRRKLLQPKG